MNRLTYRKDDGQITYPLFTQGGYFDKDALLVICTKRLCEYEDTGLTPDEISEMKADNKRLHKIVDDIESVMGGDHDERKTH